jgi:hypothetical protein
VADKATGMEGDIGRPSPHGQMTHGDRLAIAVRSGDDLPAAVAQHLINGAFHRDLTGALIVQIGLQDGYICQVQAFLWQRIGLRLMDISE